jgi:hypothetical protein
MLDWELTPGPGMAKAAQHYPGACLDPFGCPIKYFIFDILRKGNFSAWMLKVTNPPLRRSCSERFLRDPRFFLNFKNVS